MDFIKNFLKNASPKAKLIAFGTAVACLLVLIATIINFIIIHQPAPVYINIENFSESLSSADLPDYYKAQIQQLVWDSISKVDNAYQSNPIPATIRENIIKNDQDRYTVLVDVPSLRYSFRVSFSWNPEIANQPYIEPGYYIECPYPDEVIYPETPCPIGSPDNLLKPLLPVDIESNGLKIHAEYYSTPSKSTITLSINSCKNQELTKKGELYFRNWLKDNYLDPNNFDFALRSTCE